MFNLYDLSKCSPSVQEYGDWNWSRRPKEFPSLSDTHPFPRWIPAPASSSTAQPASPQLAQENFSRPFLPLPLSQHWSSPSRYGSSLQPPVIPATQCSRPAHIPAHQTRMGYTPTRATQVLSQGTYFREKQKSRKDTASFCLAMSVCLSLCASLSAHSLWVHAGKEAFWWPHENQQELSIPRQTFKYCWSAGQSDCDLLKNPALEIAMKVSGFWASRPVSL